MFNNIERELSDGEPWSFGQYSQLPPHIQLLVEKEQGRQDIWKLPMPKIFKKKSGLLKRTLLFLNFRMQQN